MRRHSRISIFFALCAGACQRDPENVRASIGTGNLPLVASSPTESVRLTFIAWRNQTSQNLDLILTPDSRLLVKRYELEWDGPVTDPKVRSQTQETVQLSPGQVADLRSRLNVFRPPKLDQNAPFVLPKDCGFIYDGTSRAVVEFRERGGAAGLFILQDGCDNANAQILEAALKDAVASVPEIRAAAGFRW